MNRIRHILVAVSGNTPQIVTETIYALTVLRDPPVHLSEVHIITTVKGSEVAWAALGGPDGALNRLCIDHAITPAIGFSREHIHVIGDGTIELEDIRTSTENQILQSFLLGLIKTWTVDPDLVLHCSLGGGRRTMSAYMLLAMTLYGREQDSLTHVLVQEEFESNNDFFFPPRVNQLLPVQLRGRKLDIVGTDSARIELAEIPFVRLRTLNPAALHLFEQNLETEIALIQQHVNLKTEPTEVLVVNLKRRLAWYCDHPLALVGLHLALVAYYADRKINHCSRPDLTVCGNCRECFQTAYEIDLKRFKELYRRTFTKSTAEFEEKARNVSLVSDDLMQYHNGIRRKCRDLSKPFAILSHREGGRTSYGLGMDKSGIKLIE